MSLDTSHKLTRAMWADWIPKHGEEPPARHVDLLDLRADQCRWAFGDDGKYTFCGHQTAPRSSYCAHHHKRVYR